MNFHKIKNTITAFSKSVGHLFRDTKAVVGLMRGDAELSRRDTELCRSTIAALKKVSLFLILQAPPVIGLLPIAVALGFPRQILTHHFWSESQRQLFLEEELQERQCAADCFIKDLPTGLQAPCTFSGWQKLSPAQLPSPHINQLSRSLALYSCNFGYYVSPNAWLLRRMRTYAEEIVQDDCLLRKEGLSALDHSELQAATIRRGLSPLSPTEEMQSCLDRWLAVQMDGGLAGPLTCQQACTVAQLIASNLAAQQPRPSSEPTTDDQLDEAEMQKVK